MSFGTVNTEDGSNVDLEGYTGIFHNYTFSQLGVTKQTTLQQFYDKLHTFGKADFFTYSWLNQYWQLWKDIVAFCGRGDFYGVLFATYTNSTVYMKFMVHDGGAYEWTYTWINNLNKQSAPVYTKANDISNRTSKVRINGKILSRNSFTNSEDDTGINDNETINSILSKIDGYIYSFWPFDMSGSGMKITNRLIEDSKYKLRLIFFQEGGEKLSRISYQVNEPQTAQSTGINTWYNVLSPNPGSSAKAGDARFDLGGAAQYAWSNLAVQKAPIVTSDKKLKDNIEDVPDDFVKSFVMGIKPKKYKLKDGDRIHYGLIAQDVEELIFSLGLTREDFGGLCVNNLKDLVSLLDTKGEKQKIDDAEDEETYSLRYEEFLSPLFRFVQMQQEQIEELKQEIERIKEQINF